MMRNVDSTRSVPLFVLVAASLVVSPACRDRSPGECTALVDADFSAACEMLDASRLDNTMVLAGDADGRVFAWSRNRGEDEVMPIASATKWLTAAVFMRLVERGEMTLDDHPQDHLSWASDDADDPRSQITLAHLLSFTSGLNVAALERSCVNEADNTIAGCAQTFYEDHHDTAPGTTYYYGPAHMQLAAAMAEAATGESWARLVETLLTGELGMSETGYVNPSEQNARASGGAQSTAAEYEKFLLAMVRGEYLASSLEEMHRDRTPEDDVDIAQSPADAFGQGWHYGLGNWLECPHETWRSQCDDERIVSSPGAFGFHPWIDRDRGMYGIVARQDNILTSPGGDSAVLMQQLRPLLYEALGR